MPPGGERTNFTSRVFYGAIQVYAVGARLGGSNARFGRSFSAAFQPVASFS
jgi:hypothetical protein